MQRSPCAAPPGEGLGRASVFYLLSVLQFESSSSERPVSICNSIVQLLAADVWYILLRGTV